MSRIPKTTPQVTVRASWWAEGESVTLQTYLSSYDRQKIADASYRLYRTEGKGEAMPVERRLHESSLTALEVGVLSWTWTFDDGTPIPLERGNLEKLDQRDADYILAELEKMWAAWREPVSVTDSQPPEEREADSTHEANFPLRAEPRATRRAK